MIINGENLILGRLSTVAAKRALKGEKVDIVNCEKIVIVGNKDNILANYKQKHEVGSVSKGPFQPKMPDRLVRRTIRGMLPYKQAKGKKAFQSVMCYIGIPDSLKDKKLESLKEAHIENKMASFITLADVCRILWGKRV